MECSFVKEKIEQFVYDKINRPDDEIIRHISGCPECQAWLKSCQSIQKITAILSRIEPVITDPQQLTNNIMAEIDEPLAKKSRQQTKVLGMARKLLAAASVMLFIVFSGEQYIFVKKVIKLENSLSAAPNIVPTSGLYKKMISYYPDKGLQLVRSELAREGTESKQMDFKAMIMVAGYSILSGKEIVNQAKNQPSAKQGFQKSLKIINKN